MSRPSLPAGGARALGLVAACIALLAAPAHAAAPEGPASPRPARIAYVQQTPRGSVELRLFDPASRASEVVAVRSDRPALLVWRLDRPLLLTVGSDSVYATPLAGKPYVSEPIGDPPPKGLAVQDGWVAKDGRGLVVAGALEGANGASSCVLYDVPSSGAWRKLAEQPAQGQAGCEAMWRSQRVPTWSVSSPALMAAYSCAAPDSVCATIGDTRYGSARQTLMRAAKGLENAAFADPLRQGGVYLGFGVQMGDTPHLMGPARLFRHDGGAASPAVVKTATQVQVGVRGPFVLVAEEYTGQDPVVIDARSGQVVLSTRQASDAVWVP